MNMFSAPARPRNKSQIVSRVAEELAFSRSKAELDASLAAEAAGTLVEGYEPVAEQ